MNALDIDTRTDVYSLGVLLYELLVGDRPFDDRLLRRAGFAEIQRIIREEDPPTPSTRLSTLGDRIDDLSRKRRLAAGALRRELRGDLDWITMKALDKDRTRRYPSASEFAADIHRYLTHVPVIAGPPTMRYRAAKFLRRHRALVAGLLAVVIVAGLGAAGMIWITWRSSIRDTTARLNQRELWLIQAVQAAEGAHWTQADKAFGEALRIDPNHASSLIEYGRMKWKQYKALDPQSVSPLQDRLLDDAERMCREGVKLDPKNQTGWNTLGIVFKIKGRYPEALAAYETACQLQPSYFPAWVNLGTMAALNHNLDAAQSHLTKATQLVAGEMPEYAAQAWRNLASLQLYRHDPAAAETIDRAVRVFQQDAGSNILRARLRLSLTGFEDVEGARQDVEFVLRSKLDRGLAGKAKRILALACLPQGRFEQAVQNAEAAIDLKDLAALNHLIIAVATAKRQDVEQCRHHLQLAEEDWPAELRNTGDYRAEAPAGVLWFDTADELYNLKAEAELTLATLLPSP